LAISVFLGAAILATYVIAGYPLLLRYLAKHHARPIRFAPIQPSISVIVPVYNGDRYLEDKIRSILALDYPREHTEIIVVSDGSTDATDTIARRFEPDGVRLLRLPRSGKPAALNAAIAQARGEILVLTDVRQVLAPDSAGLIVQAFADPQVGAVSGELVIREGAGLTQANIGLYWKFESWVRERLSSIDSMFGATGPFYALRRELAVPIPPDILLDDMYLPLQAFFRGYRLVVDKRAKAFDYPTSLETEFDRKVRTLAGNYQLLTICPALLGPANRMWLHYHSYKVGRLLLPWCCIAVAISSWWLPPVWRDLAGCGQLAVYGLVILDPVLPPQSPIRQVSAPARAFITMMVAALRALSIFFVPARSLWKVTSASGKALDRKGR
jgi:poly-beta-1,6-N-acetyl-D-glucosamine synthase